jgi:hypothetical protein
VIPPGWTVERVQFGSLLLRAGAAA